MVLSKRISDSTRSVRHQIKQTTFLDRSLLQTRLEFAMYPQAGFKFVVLLLGKQCLEKLKVLNKYRLYNKALKLCNGWACPLVDRISVNMKLEQRWNTVLSSGRRTQDREAAQPPAAAEIVTQPRFNFCNSFSFYFSLEMTLASFYSKCQCVGSMPLDRLWLVFRQYSGSSLPLQWVAMARDLPGARIKHRAMTTHSSQRPFSFVGANSHYIA